MGAFRSIASDVLHLGYAMGALDSQTGRLVSGIISAVRLFTSLKAVLATSTMAQQAHNITVSANATLQATAGSVTLGAAGAHNAFSAAVVGAAGAETTFMGAVIGATGAQVTLTGATITHTAAEATSSAVTVGASTSLWGKVTALVAATGAKIAHTAALWAYNVAQAVANALSGNWVSIAAAGAAAAIVGAMAVGSLANATRDAASAQREYNAELARAPRSIRRAGEEDLRNRGIEY